MLAVVAPQLGVARRVKQHPLAHISPLCALGTGKPNSVGLGTQVPPCALSTWSSSKPCIRRLARAGKTGSVQRCSQGANLGAQNFPTFSFPVGFLLPALRRCRQQSMVCSAAASSGIKATLEAIMGMQLLIP